MGRGTEGEEDFGQGRGRRGGLRAGAWKERRTLGWGTEGGRTYSRGTDIAVTWLRTNVMLDVHGELMQTLLSPGYERRYC